MSCEQVKSRADAGCPRQMWNDLLLSVTQSLSNGHCPHLKTRNNSAWKGKTVFAHLSTLSVIAIVRCQLYHAPWAQNPIRWIGSRATVRSKGVIEHAQLPDVDHAPTAATTVTAEPGALLLSEWLVPINGDQQLLSVLPRWQV